MTLHWPQIMWIIMTVILQGIGIYATAKEGHAGSVLGMITVIACETWLLYMGGFFG